MGKSILATQRGIDNIRARKCGAATCPNALLASKLGRDFSRGAPRGVYCSDLEADCSYFRMTAPAVSFADGSQVEFQRLLNPGIRSDAHLRPERGRAYRDGICRIREQVIRDEL